MKILFMHADYLEYEVKERTRFAEDVENGRRTGRMADPLIAFTCVEGSDERLNGIVEEAKKEIEDVAKRLRSKNIALFPFAHLSSDLAPPPFAIKVLADLESSLKEDGYSVLRVPFGWYKVFEFRTKGHPLAVLSRSIPNSTRKMSG
ncbi:MAG: threonyl-tRNA synthetase editing domain-containing protein [Candidatus Hadarchaeales archaeon]